MADKAGLQPVLIIAGPTASGKSALAVELAVLFDGVVINADALQVYRDLRILSARPDGAAMARAPHRFYGYLDAAERGSVADWLILARHEITAAHAAGRLPIVVGGTGLYLRALQRGLAAVPAIPAAVRAKAAALFGSLGGAAFREELATLDPDAASRLPPGDRQRLIRAWEVVTATGRSIGAWQAEIAAPVPHHLASILLMPPRPEVYAACDRRFAAMIDHGGLDEAAALLRRGIDPGLPAMKGVGIPELLSHLRGEIDLVTAIALAQRATRRYAKRQMTWFRHQLQPDLLLVEKYSESLLHCSRHFIQQWLTQKA